MIFLDVLSSHVIRNLVTVSHFSTQIFEVFDFFSLVVFFTLPNSD